MRDIIQKILSSQVPVVVYVGPPGARAASAGAFILMASHVAAMAQNTATGAAHPVAGGGGTLEGALEDKVVNDAVAYITSLAKQRGRNVDWAKRAVTESISSSETDALNQGVIEIVATDIPDLLNQLDGREVALLNGTVTLHTAAVDVSFIDMNFIEGFLFVISDPNVAYILLSLAMTGLFLELANPGAILPGVLGGIALLLAFFSLGMLPVNWAGLLLIGLSFIFFVAEVLVISNGLLTIGGIASLTLGSLILIASDAPYFAINRWLIGGVVITVAAFFFFIVGAIVRTYRRRATTGHEGLVGKSAIARTPLKPEGQVFLQGERWQATVEEGEIDEGEQVIVTAVDGMKLKVTKAN
jgi:membrane-bound serine protease (ClpP class)